MNTECSCFDMDIFILSEYVGEWDVGDDPMTEHRSLFPHCPFMQGSEVGNLPIQEDNPSQSNTVGGDNNAQQLQDNGDER